MARNSKALVPDAPDVNVQVKLLPAAGLAPMALALVKDNMSLSTEFDEAVKVDGTVPEYVPPTVTDVTVAVTVSVRSISVAVMLPVAVICPFVSVNAAVSGPFVSAGVSFVPVIVIVIGVA